MLFRSKLFNHRKTINPKIKLNPLIDGSDNYDSDDSEMKEIKTDRLIKSDRKSSAVGKKRNNRPRKSVNIRKSIKADNKDMNKLGLFLDSRKNSIRNYRRKSVSIVIRKADFVNNQNKLNEGVKQAPISNLNSIDRKPIQFQATFKYPRKNKKTNSNRFDLTVEQLPDAASLEMNDYHVIKTDSSQTEQIGRAHV